MGLLLTGWEKKREACNGKTSDGADWLESGMGLAEQDKRRGFDKNAPFLRSICCCWQDDTVLSSEDESFEEIDDLGLGWREGVERLLVGNQGISGLLLSRLSRSSGRGGRNFFSPFG